MKATKHTIKRFISDGQAMEVVEYAIIVGLIVAAALISIAAVGAWMKGRYDTVKGELGA